MGIVNGKLLKGVKYDNKSEIPMFDTQFDILTSQ